ncbi:MAG: hypothetical protein HC859_11510 [Bacteroidia bacterium]|nr:hypothetical protein [Bacteroidia bacterium]
MMLINSDAPKVNIINSVFGEGGSLTRFETEGFSVAMSDHALLTLVHNIDRTLRSLPAVDPANFLKTVGYSLTFKSNGHSSAPKKHRTDRVITTLKSLRKLANFCLSRDCSLQIEKYHEEIDFPLTGI